LTAISARPRRTSRRSRSRRTRPPPRARRLDNFDFEELAPDAAAGHAYLAFDPQMTEDRQHVEALAGPNVTRLPLRHFGHKLPPSLLKMGVLKDLSLAALENRLTAQDFARLLRARRRSVQWQIDLLTRARKTGHQRLALPVAQALAAENPNWRLRRLCRDLIHDLRLRDD
jgi:hypothetical protein